MCKNKKIMFTFVRYIRYNPTKKGIFMLNMNTMTNWYDFKY